jgi:hypothetical protein
LAVTTKFSAADSPTSEKKLCIGASGDSGSQASKARPMMPPRPLSATIAASPRMPAT